VIFDEGAEAMTFVDRKELAEERADKFVAWFFWAAAPAAFLGTATGGLIWCCISLLQMAILHHFPDGIRVWMVLGMVPTIGVVGVYFFPRELWCDLSGPDPLVLVASRPSDAALVRVASDDGHCRDWLLGVP
jgi:TRAP-type C4-dicarboxylate transport system permease small subunit